MTETPPPVSPATAAELEALPEIRVDPTNLRGLTHPLRLRILGSLRRGGPATATQLAAQLGESSGSLSYHLRQLETYGFVVDDERTGTGRERWWRAAHRSTRFDDTDASPEQKLVGHEFLRAVGRVYSDRLQRYADRLETLDDEVGPEYAKASTMSDWILRLTPERALEFRVAVEALAEGFRSEPDTGEEIVPVTAMFVLMPGRTA